MAGINSGLGGTGGVVAVHDLAGAEHDPDTLSDLNAKIVDATLIDTSDPRLNPWVEDEFVPTAGQVTFILSQTPNDPSSFSLSVNGVQADDAIDFTLSGTTVTWLNNLYTMETTDLVVANYR